MTLPENSKPRDPRLIVDHCTTCGMGLHDRAEFHPHAFCVLFKAGQDPWNVTVWIAEQLSLVDIGEMPPRPPLVRDLHRV